MGLFGFGNSNKTQIQMCTLKISTGLGQIEQEFQHSGGEVTPMIKGIVSALYNEARTLEKLMKPNGRTDWDLHRSLMVKWHDGREISFSTFESMLNNEARVLKIKTGIDIGIWLQN